MPTQKQLNYIYSSLAILFGMAGLGWLSFTIPAYTSFDDPSLLPQAIISTGDLSNLNSNINKTGIMAPMNSPAFDYSPGWRINELGADPPEPPDPWREPAGTVTFTYQGNELALLLATGNYWGYLYVTVDGEPANLLPMIAGNMNAAGKAAGYKTLYEPKRIGAFGEPTERWVRVHNSKSASGIHRVRVEIWRSWGQVPLRGVAIDGLPPIPRPIWPGVLLLTLGGWSLLFLFVNGMGKHVQPITRLVGPSLQKILTLLAPQWLTRWAWLIAISGFLLTGVGIATDQWLLCLIGLALLAYAALHSLAFWSAALLFSLPFYYMYTLPFLPNRAFNLIDIGIFGGVILWLFHRLVATPQPFKIRPKLAQNLPLIALCLLITWSFVTIFSAQQIDLAFREWRTVFLNSGLFALLLIGTLQSPPPRLPPLLPQSLLPISNRAINVQNFLIFSWLFGGTVVAIVGLWQYITGTMLIEAEGVQRVRAFYGSPNNLALYLDRTVAVGLAFTLLTRARRTRLFWAALTLPQLIALLFTFSKGGVFLGMPMLFIVLGIGGAYHLRQQGESYRRLWWLVGIALGALLLLGPFLSAERFQRLFDFNGGTTSLRLYLWRSSWTMAWDYWLTGVGPDNFLYLFRSGYLLPEAWQEPNLNHPHNWVLDWWTRLGLTGLGLALLFFTAGFWGLWQNIRHRIDAICSLGFLAAGSAALAHGLIDLSYALPDLMLVWVFLLIAPSIKSEDTSKSLHTP